MSRCVTPEAIIIAAIVIDIIVVDVTVNQASAAAVLPVSLFSLQLRIKELVVQYMQATYFGVYRVPQPTVNIIFDRQLMKMTMTSTILYRCRHIRAYICIWVCVY